MSQYLSPSSSSYSPSQDSDVPLMDFLPLPDAMSSPMDPSLHPSFFNVAHHTESILSNLSPTMRMSSQRHSLPHSLSDAGDKTSHGSPASTAASSSTHSPTGYYPLPQSLPRQAPNKRTSSSAKAAQERKPPLACYFCRGRKICCGQPADDNPDRTCK